MKRLLLVITIVFISCLLSAEAVAYLSASKGSVTFSRSNKSVKIKTGDLLENKDEIRTGGESFAAYKFIDGAANIRVFANSIVEINAKKQGNKLNKSVGITKGSILSNVKGGSGTFNVETPTTVASVRGTGFLTKVTEDKQTIIIVTEGEVMVEAKGSGQVRSVGAGNTASVDERGSIEVEKTSAAQMNEVERAEIEASSEPEPKTLRIQVTDDDGNIRYIDVTY